MGHPQAACFRLIGWPTGRRLGLWAQRLLTASVFRPTRTTIFRPMCMGSTRGRKFWLSFCPAEGSSSLAATMLSGLSMRREATFDEF